jgi:hypothetical protein
VSAAELLAELESCGVVLEVAGDRLRFDAPKGALTPELRKAMAQQKAELMALLAPPPSVGTDAADMAAMERDERDQATVKVRTRRPPPPTDPGGYCAVHRRLLTYREQMAGACSWCSGAVQLDRPVRAPAPRTCLECGGPLPSSNKYFCWGCVGARAEHAEKELPY